MTSITDPISGLGSYFVQNNYLNESTVKEVLKNSSIKNISFTALLAQEHYLSSRQIAEAISSYFELPFFDLNQYHLDISALNIISIDLIKKYLALPLCTEKNQLFLAVADPTVIDINEINFLTNFTTSLIVVERDKLTKTIDLICSHQLKSSIEFEKNPLNLVLNDSEDIENHLSQIQSDNAPVVKFLNQILLEAIKKNASDIHFEPYSDYYRIRFRIDGILYEISQQSVKLVNFLTARLKIMANLDISERRIPQDGGFKISFSKNEVINFRLNICPTLYGEKSVVRILNSSDKLLDIDYLGMNESQKKLFSSALTQSQGLIIVTGPTGSGKTMTLYSALNKLNTTAANICAVEDPIEMYLSGINQVQINLKTELTFTTVLRAFLRQDPDVIMIGEIRDLETAEIAVKAAQTGHLVFSTLHTNSAIETMTRLSAIGLNPYYLANSILLIIAQRLVRCLCQLCKIKIKISESELLEEGFDSEEINNLTLYEPHGCSECQSGYKGRLGVFEVLPISKQMSKLIIENANYLQLSEQIKKENIPNLRRCALDKVKAGLTSLEEINRVIKK